MKTALVCGAGGFIGSHLCYRLKELGYRVIGVDLEKPCYRQTACDNFFILDLTREDSWNQLATVSKIDEIYQLAAKMGGAGFIFTGDNDAEIMSESALINLHCAKFATKIKARVFYSSSACIYPSHNQLDPNNPNCKEDSAYPANPDSEYGWEKLFSERLYKAFERNYGLVVRIARFHNIYGPYGAWDNGKEKAPAAMCRKVAKAEPIDTIEIWGDGEQTRSFLYIDACLDGIMKLMHSDSQEIVNIGSTEMVTINQLVRMVSKIAGKSIAIKHLPGPLGVRGRNSDNQLILSELGWEPVYSLEIGLRHTFSWINRLVSEGAQDKKL